jgi:WD40 repeat protein
MRIKASSLPALKMVEFSSVHCQITQVIHVHIKPWYCFCGYWFAVVDTENCPITFAFVAHHGPVYSVDCSPFHRNLFVTSSTDTTIRLYNMLQSKPLLSIEPGAGYVFTSIWSPVRPMVLAAATSEKQLLFYDLRDSHITPVTTVEHKKGLYSVEFNTKRHQLVASGDAGGTVKVWQLSNQLVTQGLQEIQELDQLAEFGLD